MSEDWVDGTLESGADDETENEPIEPGADEADADGGVEMGIGEGSTFEPEEDTDV